MIEVDTLSVFESVPNPSELDYTPGGFHYDAVAQRLYIAPSDLQPPERHHYTVSVLQGRGGLFLHRPRRIVVDGLSATGYHSARLLTTLPGGTFAADQNQWGIFLAHPKRCTIRNVTSYLNAGGIAIRSHRDIEIAGKNVIEHCVAYANSPRHGIIAYIPNEEEIRYCKAFLNRSKGVEFYLGGGGRSRMLKNIAWDNRGADVQLKAGGPHLAERVVGVGGWGQESRSDDVAHSIIGRIRSIPDQYQNNIVLSELRGIDLGDEFADPESRDYRLQATSQFRGQADDGGDLGPFPYEENIYYVKKDGDDAHDGLSVRQAWRTLGRAFGDLKPGDTLYIQGGAYRLDQPLTAGSPDGESISIRGRGRNRVLIEGRIVLSNASGIQMSRLVFEQAVAVEDSTQIAFDDCEFLAAGEALVAENVEGITLRQCMFGLAAPTFIASSNVFMSGNVFAGTLKFDRSEVAYSDYNGYLSTDESWRVDGQIQSLKALQETHERSSRKLETDIVVVNGAAVAEDPVQLAAGGPGATALGRFSFAGMPKPDLRFSQPHVHSVTDTTANIEWWTSIPSRSEIAWGETPACENVEEIDAPHFATYSLTGLELGKSYYFTIRRIRPLDHLNPLGIEAIRTDAQPMRFATADGPRASRTFYVAPDGDDDNTGLSRDHAWRHVNRAASEANTGDTVLIAEGEYCETVRVRSTGVEGRPIVFKAVPGERVVFDGDDRNLNAAFDVRFKDAIVFDALRFRRFGRGSTNVSGWMGYPGYGTITLYRTAGVRITRCLMDGRWNSYSSPFFSGARNENLLIKNCVVCSGMSNLSFAGGVADLRLENNVLIRPLIFQAVLSGGPVYMNNNIITDNLPNKEGAPLFELGSAEWFHLENNCFFLRQRDESERRQPIFRFIRDEEFGDTPLSRMATVAQYDAKMGDSRSVFTDPMFTGASGIELTDGGGKPHYYTVDAFVKSPHLRVTSSDEFEFSDFFTTSPELIERGIGLEPEAFADFHFNVAD